MFLIVLLLMLFVFFFSSRRRHTICALVTGVQTCALPISSAPAVSAIDRRSAGTTGKTEHAVRRQPAPGRWLAVSHPSRHPLQQRQDPVQGMGRIAPVSPTPSRSARTELDRKSTRLNSSN